MIEVSKFSHFDFATALCLSIKGLLASSNGLAWSVWKSDPRDSTCGRKRLLPVQTLKRGHRVAAHQSKGFADGFGMGMG